MDRQIRVPDGLTFNAEKHEYKFNGEKVPGVNEILRKIGLSKDYSSVDPFYSLRGSMVHECVRLYLNGTLDENSVDEQLVPYFNGFRRYWDKFGTKPKAVEIPLYSSEYGGFAGTPDLVTEDEIVDWKCSKDHDKVAELQGEGYKVLVGGERSIRFKVVQLCGDGNYEIFDYGRGTDLWKPVMQLYGWKTSRKTKRSTVGCPG